MSTGEQRGLQRGGAASGYQAEVSVRRYVNLLGLSGAIQGGLYLGAVWCCLGLYGLSGDLSGAEGFATSD